MNEAIIGAAGVVLGSVIGAIAASLGSWLTYKGQHRETDVKFIELAVGLLAQKPTPNTKALRSWAVDLLTHYSREVPFSPEAKGELRDEQLGFFVGHSFVDDAFLTRD